MARRPSKAAITSVVNGVLAAGLKVQRVVADESGRITVITCGDALTFPPNELDRELAEFIEAKNAR
jgi:hypothetical protein